MSAQQTFSRKVLNKAETARLLDISERTLSRWHAEGIGPPRIEIKRKISYLEESVLDWLVSHERKGVRQ